jgi:hypothetical protein
LIVMVVGTRSAPASAVAAASRSTADNATAAVHPPAIAFNPSYCGSVVAAHTSPSRVSANARASLPSPLEPPSPSGSIG